MEDIFAEFLASWSRIRIQEGQGPLELAFAQAQSRSIIPNEPPSLVSVDVVSTAYYLQRERGRETPIFLRSCGIVQACRNRTGQRPSPSHPCRHCSCIRAA